MPITVHFGQKTFEAGVDIDDARLFARVDGEGKLPTTFAPAPDKFAEAYQAAFDAGAEAVLCFCVSGEVSATYSTAVNARDLLPERDITVVDSRSLAMGQGFMVLATAEAAQAGAFKDEIVAHALAVGERTYLYAALSTLKYLTMRVTEARRDGERGMRSAFKRSRCAPSCHAPTTCSQPNSRLACPCTPGLGLLG